jgi:hypothetical protein
MRGSCRRGSLCRERGLIRAGGGSGAVRAGPVRGRTMTLARGAGSAGVVGAGAVGSFVMRKY